jgi:hypothetical protein
VLYILKKHHKYGVVTCNNIAEMELPKEATLEHKKGRTREATTLLEVEETLGESLSESTFPREYIPSRKDDAKIVNLNKEA